MTTQKDITPSRRCHLGAIGSIPAGDARQIDQHIEAAWLSSPECAALGDCATVRRRYRYARSMFYRNFRNQEAR